MSILLLLLLSFAAFALELWVKRAPQDYFKVHKVGDSGAPEPWSYDFGDSNAWSIEKWTRPTHVGDGLIMQGPGVAMPDNLAGLAFYRSQAFLISANSRISLRLNGSAGGSLRASCHAVGKVTV